MAYLYPDVIRECKSPAEKELFARFKNFSNDFHIIHSLPWLSSYVQEVFYKQRKKFTPEGEIDFVILHKDFGILCLEIKGGQIRYDGHSYFNATRRLNKNPYDQSREGKYLIKDILKEKFLKINVGYALGIPHVSAPFFNEETNEITFDKNDLNKLEDKIISIYHYWNKLQEKGKSSLSEIKEIINLLIPSNQEIINNKIEYDNKYWLTLSDEQNIILGKAIEVNKFFISGMAGTGKTILAKILARNFSKKNKVLFLTYNKEIRYDIAIDFQGNKNISVFTFHSFLKEYNRLKNKIDVVKYSNDILDFIVKNITNEYDILIIDEAQSLIAHWMLKLSYYFENKKIYICSDEFQSFSYEGKITNQQMRKIFHFDDEMILSLNYRSPKKVYTRLLEMFSPSVQQYSPRGNDELDLEEIITFDVKNEIIKIIDKLLLEKVKKNNIVILIPGRDKKNIELYRYQNISVKTVEEYRGMEVPIVIYIITSASEKDLHEFYVAYSRATTRTIVIIREDVLSLGCSYYEKMLVESPITHNKIKKKIKESHKQYMIDIVSNCTNTEVLNYKVYISQKYILLLNEDNKFINKLLVDYLVKQNIPVIQMSENNIKHVNLTIDSSICEYQLEYQLCDKCYEKSFINNKFCVNCNLEQLTIDSIKKMKKDFSVVNGEKSKMNGKLLNDSLRSLGRFRHTSMNKKITKQIYEMLNKQSKVKYISCIIEFLIRLDRYNKDEISLGYIREHKDIRILNCFEEDLDDKNNWKYTTAHCVSIFNDYQVFIKIKQGHYKIEKKNLFIEIVV